MTDIFRTIKSPSRGEYKDKKSKFYSFAFPVETEDEIKLILSKFRKEYHDARHYCYAYMLGADKKTFRSNDDGEPSNSAGKPILGQIQSYELSDVLIVVIRYFGGVLLGVGGLINAYRTAASESLKNAEIVNKTVKANIEISFEYNSLNKVMQIIKSRKPEIIEQNFDLECNMSLRIRISELESLCAQLNKVDKLICKNL